MKKSKDVMDYSEENFAIVFAAMGVSPQLWGTVGLQESVRSWEWLKSEQVLSVWN